MLETHESALVDVPDGLAEPGEFAWNWAFTRLNVHWLHVTTRSRHADNDYGELRNLFLMRMEDFETVLGSPYWEITEVNLVSPGHMNGSGRWEMAPLREVLKGLESGMDHDQFGYVFVLCSGERYAVSSRDREEDLADLTSIYDAES